MTNLRRILVAIAAALLCCAAASDDATPERPLQGDYYFGGATLVDAPPDEPQDTHLRMHLTGTAAKDLWQAMRVDAIHDECRDDGSRVKQIGGTQCELDADGRTYECWFALDIARQQVVDAITC
jgi:hypothetical protein